MGAIRIQSGVLLGVIVLLVLSGCGGSDGSSSEPTLPPATLASDASATPVPTTPPTKVEAQSTPVPAETEAQPTAAPAEEPTQPAEPEDVEGAFEVPIMDGATNVQILDDTGSVTYVMKGTVIEDVVAFYEASMAEHGWSKQTGSAIGMMATLVFETDNARMSASLQANTIAKTVTVRISVFEK